MAVIAGLFVLETLSVLLQMSYFKITRRITGTGRRIFRIAPIHHHFEHLGWDEVTVVIRFSISPPASRPISARRRGPPASRH